MDQNGMEIPVTLIIKAPNQKYSDQTISCFLNWTVGKLKTHLSNVYPSKPVSVLKAGHSCSGQQLFVPCTPVSLFIPSLLESNRSLARLRSILSSEMCVCVSLECLNHH